MTTENVKAKDMTEFDGPVDTGNPSAKRPADKKNGDKSFNGLKGKEGTELPGTTTVGEDLNTLFADVEGLSEDFTSKVSVILEGAISEKVSVIREALEEEYEARLEEAYQTVSENLETHLDNYLNLFVENYMEDNKVAIERGIRNELSEEIIKSVQTIIENAGVTLPEEKIDIAEALVVENEKLETKYNESLHENIELKKTIRQYQISEAFEKQTSGLSEGSKDKLKRLIENMEFADVEQFNSKMDILKESITEKTAGPAKTNLTEASESVERPQTNSRMQAYISAARGNEPKK